MVDPLPFPACAGVACVEHYVVSSICASCVQGIWDLNRGDTEGAITGSCVGACLPDVGHGADSKGLALLSAELQLCRRFPKAQPDGNCIVFWQRLVSTAQLDFLNQPSEVSDKRERSLV